MARRIPVALVAGALLGFAACAPAEDATADAAAGAVSQEAAPSEAEVRTALAERMAAHEQALMAGDADVLLGFWTDDAHLREPGIDFGKAEFDPYIREVFGSGARIDAIDIRTEEVFVHGDVAYELGEYDETIVMPDAPEPMTYRNHYFLRWERGDDGVWRFDRFVAGPREAPEGM